MDKKISDNLYSKCEKPQQFKLTNDKQITIQVTRPFGYRQIVTLYPMSFDITDEVIKNLTINCNKLKHFEFGKHKKFPSIHNPYLHLYIENLKKSAIPDTINFRNIYIFVTVDREQPKSRCSYCKKLIIK